MTEKNKERGINVIIALIVSFSGVFMAFKLNDSADRDRIIQESIESKADLTYVDKQNAKQDAAIIEVKTLFLFEVQELRKDLRLKAEKK